MTSTQSISVELPDELYERIREVAERNERSVESVLRESLEVMFGGAAVESEDLLSRMETFRDDQLWAVVYQRMAWPQKERLRELTTQGKTGELSLGEQADLKALLDQVDRYTLLRSRALQLLQQRGHEVDRYLMMGV
jgi:predicted DNA-binding protein